MTRFLYGGFAACLLALGVHAQDPPSRIARLNYVRGTVSMQPAGVDDWAPAEPNRPLTTGDTLYSDSASRAELHLDTAVVRAGEYTSLGFLTLNDQTVQLRLTQGDLYVNLRDLEPDQTFEVDTPSAAVSLLRPGLYRFRIGSNGGLTFVVVRRGQAEVTGGGQAFNLTPGNSASISGGGGEFRYNVEMAPQPDDFDLWSEDRDGREARLESRRYVPPSVVGYEDLDEYGGWQNEASYGEVWYPRRVAPGWAPYREGHWAWIEPWGWTWVDDEPWGFAPFHYGRWAYISGRWGWCPGPIAIVDRMGPVIRPVYAPALVAWFGGSHFGVSVSIGGGSPDLGWVPLGYGEVYTPSYRCSPRYFNNVNVSNTTVVKTVNITNVYNNVYVNKTVYNQNYVNMQAPNAVTAMPQAAFASGRRVSQAGGAVPQGQVSSFRPQAAALVSPPVVPTRQAVIGGNVSGSAVARPTAQVTARQVVVRNTPPVVPTAFAARQLYLQEHAGQPHDAVAMRQQVAPQPSSAPQFTRVAPVAAARPVAPQNGPGAPIAPNAGYRPNGPETRGPAQPAGINQGDTNQAPPRPYGPRITNQPSQPNSAPYQPRIGSQPPPAPNAPSAIETRPGLPPRPPDTRTPEVHPTPSRPVDPRFESRPSGPRQVEPRQPPVRAVEPRPSDSRPPDVRQYPPPPQRPAQMEPPANRNPYSGREQSPREQQRPAPPPEIRQSPMPPPRPVEPRQMEPPPNRNPYAGREQPPREQQRPAPPPRPVERPRDDPKKNN